MQASDRHGVATPEGWRPGDKAVLPPPSTLAEADARVKCSPDAVDWYFSRTELSRKPAPRAKAPKKRPPGK
jgi:peroxiredoxin (alkyl hydroperoxide reductase subunit C)